MSMDVIGVQMSVRTGCSPVYHHILWHYFTTPLFGSHSISYSRAQKNSPKHSVRACAAAILLIWSKLHKLSWFIYYHTYMWCIWLDNKSAITSPKECNLRISTIYSTIVTRISVINYIVIITELTLLRKSWGVTIDFSSWTWSYGWAALSNPFQWSFSSIDVQDTSITGLCWCVIFQGQHSLKVIKWFQTSCK